MYAGDLVLLAPSFMGLSMLLLVCSDYGLEHDIKYKSNKSNGMIFCSRKFKNIHIRNCMLNDEILPRGNTCKYRGHVITEELNDDDGDMAKLYKRMYAQGNA